MKNIKKLKEVTNLLSFNSLLTQDLTVYNSLNEYKQNTIILIGIGGSWLGAELLASLSQNNKVVHYINTVQPELIKGIIDQCNPLDTLVVIQSKSGKTTETLAGYNYCKTWLINNNISLTNALIFCSESGSYLHKESQKNDSKFFELNNQIGGRYSILSCMGLVLATLLDVNIEDLILGASSPLLEVDEIVQTLLNKSTKQLVLFNYNYQLTGLNPWFNQLIAESLGKDNSEITPLPALGVQDQHSLLQMFEEGENSKLCLFIPPFISNESDIDTGLGFSFNQLLKAEYQGTLASLKNSFEVIEFSNTFDNQTQYLGYLLQFFMSLTATYGLSKCINPFDQPGVEKSKQIIRALLESSKLSSK
jgi:glucose-6-phosphate isomerase